MPSLSTLKNSIVYFIKDNIVLFSSSMIANLIRVITVVYITRLYLPAEFGNYQVILSISLLLSAIGTFKYDYGIILSDDAEERRTVTSLSLFILVGMTGIVGLIFVSQIWFPLAFLVDNEWYPFIVYIPIIFLFAGAEPFFRNVFLAKKDYKRIGQINVLKTVFQQGLIILYGFYNPSTTNLLVGYLSGYLITYLFILREVNWSLIQFNHARLILVAKKFNKLPLFNAPAALVGTASNYAPIIFLGVFFSPAEVGMYAFAVRLLDIPVQVINNSTAQTYFRNLSLVKYDVQKRVLLFKKYFGVLFLISAVFAGLSYLLATPVFNRLFGEQWSGAVDLFKIMLPVVLLKYPLSSISLTTTALNRQEINVLWAILLLIGTTIVIVLFNTSIISTVKWIIAVISILNLMYILHIYSAVKSSKGISE